MPQEQILSANSLTNLFPKVYYDKSEISTPILDIWNNYRTFVFPEDATNNAYRYHIVTPKDTLYSISNTYYRTIELWWLVPLVNDYPNPFTFLEDVMSGDFIPGPDKNKTIKIIKDIYLPQIKKDMMFYKSVYDKRNLKLSESENV
jgi:hypothetical protein